jgi:hypothetical protein
LSAKTRNDPLGEVSIAEQLAFLPHKHGDEYLKAALDYILEQRSPLGSIESLTSIAQELRAVGLLSAAAIIEKAAESAYHADEITLCYTDLQSRLWSELPCKESCGCWLNLEGEADYPKGHWTSHKPSRGVEMIWELQKQRTCPPG